MLIIDTLLNKLVSKEYMQKRLFGKRGDSHVIAIVLMCGAVIAVGILVFFLMKGLVVQNIAKSQDCGATEESLLDIGATCTVTGGNLQLDVTNNGGGNVDGIMVVTRCSDGSARGLSPTINPSKPGETAAFSYNVDSTCTIASCEVFPFYVDQSDRENAQAIVCQNKKIEVVVSV